MSDLDDKLQEIMLTEQTLALAEGLRAAVRDEAIDDIKQAFADAGYGLAGEHAGYFRYEQLAHDFYDRFERAIEAIGSRRPFKSERDIHKAKIAAKRAAGLDT